MNRRFFLAGIGVTGLLPATPAFAITEAGATKLIDALVGDINKVIASGKSETSMYRDFERIFQRYSDTSYISAYAMGVDGRRATASQKRAFSKAFQSALASGRPGRYSLCAQQTCIR